MLEETAIDFAKYADVHLQKKLEPINQSIDQMLIRLEEFETMVTLVQQERCNAIGLTGALSETMDYQKELTELCTRVDALESLIQYIKSNMNSLEAKVDLAEEQAGFTEGTNKLKSFFLPLFKKQPEAKAMPASDNSEPFSIDSFFIPVENL